MFRYGPTTKVTDNRSRARDAHNIQARLRAKRALKYPPVTFTGIQARAVGRGFASAAGESGYILHACSILPDPIHLIIAHTRPHRDIRKIAGHLKARATRQLNAEDIHPLARFAEPASSVSQSTIRIPKSAIKSPTPWSRYPWNVYIDTEDHLRKAIRYVENNPLKEGKPKQRWTFVTPWTP